MNNRIYFTKNGFDILEHFGVSRYYYDENHLSGYCENFETIEELNEAYMVCAKNYIDYYAEKIMVLKESLK